jgi:hypothetical protein
MTSIKTCQHCRKPFVNEREGKRGVPRKYCSRECAVLADRERTAARRMSYCKVCGNRFSRADRKGSQTCSEECQVRMHSERLKRDKEKLTRACKQCGQVRRMATKTQEYCPTCQRLIDAALNGKRRLAAAERLAGSSHRHHFGLIAEAVFDLIARVHGWTLTAEPNANTPNYDRAIDRGFGLERVQIKSAARTPTGKVMCRPQKADRRYGIDAFDILAIVDTAEMAVYCVPWQQWQLNGSRLVGDYESVKWTLDSAAACSLWSVA